MVSGRPLRITHIITYGSIMAGAQIDTYHAARYQKARYDVEVIMGDDGPFRRALLATDVRAVVIPFRNVLVDPLGDVRALVRLTAHLRRTRPDIVHTHSSKASILGRAAARLAGVPIVVHTLHGPSYHERQSLPVRTGIKVMERVWARFTDHFVSVADTLGEDFVRDRICTPDRVRTVISGIDFATFPPDVQEARRRVRKELGIGESDWVAVAVGYVSEGKGYDVLVEAAAQVERSEPGMRYLIAGPILGVAEYKQALLRRIDELDLSGRFVFAGQRDDVPQVLSASDCYVQSSRREGLSRALVEAMYAGLPVVATDVGATREVVQDGETGYLVPMNDQGALADRLLALKRDPATAARLAARARALVGETRSVEAMGRGLDRVYRDLAVQKGLAS